MTLIAKYNTEQEIEGAEIRSLMKMLNEFKNKIGKRIKKAVELNQIEQWDDPTNSTLLLNRLEILAAKINKTENDYVTIAAICAIMSNFVEV